MFRQMFERNEHKPQTDEFYMADFEISTSQIQAINYPDSPGIINCHRPQVSGKWKLWYI
jgi:hypothetical protein